MPQNEPLTIAKFEVNIDGMTVKQFTSVQGLSMTTEALPIEEGSSQSRATRKGRTRYRNISLTRVFSGDKELVKWFQECAHGKLTKKPGSIILKSEEGKDIMRFNFRNAWPVLWEGPDFFAYGNNQVAQETIVLDVEEIEVA